MYSLESSFNYICKTYTDMRILYKILLLLLVAVSVYSCKHEKSAKDLPMDLRMQVDPRKDGSMTRTSKDTAKVLDMAKRYLDFLKENKVENALNMLVDFKEGKIIPLPDERKKQLENNIKAFPVLSYSIEGMRMYSETDTEVRFSSVFFEKEEGDGQPNSIQRVLNFRRINDTWYMSIKSSSVENNFRKEK